MKNNVLLLKFNDRPKSHLTVSYCRNAQGPTLDGEAHSIQTIHKTELSFTLQPQERVILQLKYMERQFNRSKRGKCALGSSTGIKVRRFVSLYSDAWRLRCEPVHHTGLIIAVMHCSYMTVPLELKAIFWTVRSTMVAL